MQRVLKICARALGLLVAITLIAAGYVYVATERTLAKTYDVPLNAQFEAPDDAASIESGRRLATIYGCTNCHGSLLNGTVMFDEPGVARVSAPNLTRVLRDYSDAELERVIRRGVKKDGTSNWIMPSQMFTHLTDEDLGKIIAFVRTAPPRDGVQTEVSMRALGRIGIATGKFRPVVTQIAADREPKAPNRQDPLSHGKYLVMTACTECHGSKLEGSEIVNAPSLLVTAAYSKEDFARLMRTGVGIGGRKLGLMTEMGVARFSSFTDTEVEAVRTYLEAFVRQGGTRLP